MATGFRVWVTLMTDAVVDVMVGRLVRLGFTVEPLSRNKILTEKGPWGSLASLRVIPPNVERDANQILDDVRQSLEGYYWFSIVVVKPDSSSTWMVNEKPLDVAPAAPQKSSWDIIAAPETPVEKP
jgi:hypothetical protein